MDERPIELAKDGAAYLLAECDAALEAGEIVGVFKEERGDRATEHQIIAWGFRIAGATQSTPVRHAVRSMPLRLVIFS